MSRICLSCRPAIVSYAGTASVCTQLCVCVCVCARARVCVCVRVCACVVCVVCGVCGVCVVHGGTWWVGSSKLTLTKPHFEDDPLPPACASVRSRSERRATQSKACERGAGTGHSRGQEVSLAADIQNSRTLRRDAGAHR
jgi:hypothetical protein